MRISQAIFFTLFSTSNAIIPIITCDAAKRVELTERALTNINLPTAAQSLVAYTAYPFSYDISVFINVNQLSPVQFTYDRVSVLVLLATLYQVVTEVTDVYATNVDATTTFFHQLGIAHSTVPLPVYIDFVAYAKFNLATCQLQTVFANATVPAGC